jgi:peptidoglycan/LPS O-acetylase OafA/YrhL
MEFLHGGQLNYYLVIVMAGILFAQQGVFEKLERFKHKKDFIVTVGSLLLLSVLMVVRYILLPQTEEKWYLSIGPISTLMALIIVMFVYLCRTDGKISKLIQKLGTHSGNIFFIHWFFYNYLIYVLKIGIPVLGFVCCFAYCLGVSLLVEFIKKKTDYNNKIRKGLKILLRDK